MCNKGDNCSHGLLCTFGHTHSQCLEKCQSQMRFCSMLNNRTKYVPSMGLSPLKHKKQEMKTKVKVDDIALVENTDEVILHSQNDIKEKVDDIALVENTDEVILHPQNEPNSDIKVKQEMKTKMTWADYCEQLSDSEMDFDSNPIVDMDDITIEDI